MFWGCVFACFRHGFDMVLKSGEMFWHVYGMFVACVGDVVCINRSGNKVEKMEGFRSSEMERSFEKLSWARHSRGPTAVFYEQCRRTFAVIWRRVPK